MSMKINYSEDRCGAGKTRFACRMMAAQPGLWVYAIDRRDEVGARETVIREFAMEHGTQPVIRHAFSQERGMIRVHQAIADAADGFRIYGHCILFVMHEGLKMSDLSAFTGWRIVIDEIPNVWDSASVCTPSLHHQLQACYRLAEPKAGWSRVIVKPDAPSVSDLVRDDTMAPWALFHRRAKGRQGVYANLHDWADSVDGRQWQWYTLWNPLELEAFDDAWIIGNCFTQTVTFKLLSEFYGDRIEFVPFSIGAGATWERRKLTLRYFTSSHVAGSGFWSRAEGKECVRRWADWVRANSQDERHYWTANEDQLKTFRYSLPGDWCSPKIAGSNAFRDYHLCSILYTAKYNPKDDAALVQFGITPDEIVRSREYEDLIQIAFRSSLRLPHSVEPVEIRLYDMTQAEFLRDYLLSAGFDLDVELIFEDIGINGIVRGTGGRKSETAGLTEDELALYRERKKTTKAEQMRDLRAGRKAEKIAAGSYRGRGRPPKEIA
jgi:hypothetical protein